MFKGLAPQLAFLLGKRTTRQNLRTLFKLLLAFSVIVTIFSVLFHLIMLREGHDFSWFTGFYWTLTVMSTLGFGDITFQGDLGRLFSMIVLLTGMVFLLIVLPFTFIQFFYAPWIQAQSEARAPRQLPRSTREHVLLTHYDPIAQSLINKLDRYQYSYYLITPDLAHAQQLYDQGINVVVGDLDNPDTFKKMQIEQAALVATTDTDPINTHVAFTVRDLNPTVPIIARADDPNSVDILQLAGCDHVLQLEKILGASLARRTQSGDTAAHVIGQYGDLFIAETTAAHTPLVGKTLEEIGLRRELGLDGGRRLGTRYFSIGIARYPYWSPHCAGYDGDTESIGSVQRVVLYLQSFDCARCRHWRRRGWHGGCTHACRTRSRLSDCRKRCGPGSEARQLHCGRCRGF